MVCFMSKADVRAEQGAFYIENHEAVLTERLRVLLEKIDPVEVKRLKEKALRIIESRRRPWQENTLRSASSCQAK